MDGIGLQIVETTCRVMQGFWHVVASGLVDEFWYTWLHLYASSKCIGFRFTFVVLSQLARNAVLRRFFFKNKKINYIISSVWSQMDLCCEYAKKKWSGPSRMKVEGKMYTLWLSQVDWFAAICCLQVHAIMGRNGSGKSTLSKALILNLNVLYHSFMFPFPLCCSILLSSINLMLQDDVMGLSQDRVC